MSEPTSQVFSGGPARDRDRPATPARAGGDRQLQAQDNDRVYQAAGNQYFFPAGPGSSGGPAKAPNTIPRDIAAFTGRQDEIRTLSQAVPGAPETLVIYAIQGLAGIGKTALAVHAAHLLGAHFPDGQLFVHLHAHSPGQRPVDPGDALAALLTADGVARDQLPEELDNRAALWRARMADRRTLLILDDAAGHAQVAPLLPGSGRSLIIVTSRRRLTALSARHATITMTLDTLPPDDAVRLFTELIHRQLDPAETDAVAALMRACGYLPLAISLLAAKLGPEPRWRVVDLLDSLTATQDRLIHLRAEDIEVASTFSLSYRHLPAARRRFFRRLGLHPGRDFDGYAAAALDGTGLPESCRHLEMLYQDHLVDQPELGRYRMHDLVADHARALCAKDPPMERVRSIDRLLSYYLTATERANGVLSGDPPAPVADPVPVAVPAISSVDQALAWLRRESANLLACLQHAGDRNASWTMRMAAALASFVGRAGPWPDGIAMHLAAARAAERLGDRSAQTDALFNAGVLLRRTGEYSRAAAVLRQALDHARLVGCSRREADVLTELAAVLQATGQMADAARAVDAALRICQDIGDRLGEAAALKNLAVIQYLSDDCGQAANALLAALAIYEDHDDPLGRAYALFHLGVVRRMTDDYAAATQALQAALIGFEQVGHLLGQANVRHNLGIVWHKTDDYPAAERAFDAAFAAYESLGNPLGQANSLKHKGIVQLLTGDPRSAAASLERALGLYSALSDRLGQAAVLHHLGTVHQQTGDHAAAARELDQALEMYRGLANRLGQAETLNRIGALLLDRGDPSTALARYQVALRLARAVHSPLEEARALHGAARCAVRLHQTDVAVARLRQAVRIYRRIGAPEAAPADAELDDLTAPRSHQETA